MRGLLALTGIAFLLSGCLYNLREISLTDNEISRSIDNTSYLLVDKGDNSADGQLVVRRIDSNDLDIVLDPCVYVLDSGKHILSISFYDSLNQGKRLDRILVLSLQPGIYHQLMPIRDDGEIRFDLEMIPKEKLQMIGKRELKSMTNYLIKGED